MRILAVALTCLFLVAAINWVVDPHGLNWWVLKPGFNEFKSEMNSNWHTAKALRLPMVKPDILVLGSSRVLAGIDTDHPWFAGGKAFNLGLPGASFCHLDLAHTEAHRYAKVKRSIVGLDFFSANALLEPIPCEASEEQRHPWPQLAAYLGSGKVFHDSIRTVSKQRNPDPAIWQPTPRGNLTVPATFVSTHGGARSVFEKIVHTYIDTNYIVRPLCGHTLVADRNRDSLRRLRQILARAHGAGEDMHLFISPAHAHLLLAIDASGQWQPYEDFIVGVVTANEEEARRAGRPPFPLFDFAGFAPPNDEAVPDADDMTHELANYTDPSHYKPKLGRQVLDRIAGGGNPAFGIPLNSATVRPHLLQLRNDLVAYRQRYAADYQRYQDWANEARQRYGCAGNSGK
jgi:hypothetical protein